MTTFALFPRLATELRAQIWGLAVEDRVIRIKENTHSFFSATPAPAVTRACRESRACCSYQKSTAFDLCKAMQPRQPYIWVNFDHDIIHIRADPLWYFEVVRANEVKHLRIELVDEEGKEIKGDWYGQGPTTEYPLSYQYEMLDFPELESVDLLVPDKLCDYTRSIEETDFGPCSKKNVRIASIHTGEWIDEETCMAYWDHIDSSGGERLDDMTRVVHDEDGTVEERLAAIQRLEMPRPRINLDLQVARSWFLTNEYGNTGREALKSLLEWTIGCCFVQTKAI
ncbi:uncharacterized protein RCO7_01135 [Rhynchosporium graminicola]|uniref:2EXR domain-containing protein n=1 Tax=Rhynchosporium graminicola TaxID=2792576 RepID=A0A1E1JR00_9HELO|nr:uncharacterized protein RCO7_01135 [Rhynchosporium commune]